tara:strand:+ start:280 stop:774 length:495 start_codon:yes stop_codon:yes gene_type:complete
MSRYNVEMRFDEGNGTEMYPEADLPTKDDINSLFDALEDCLNAASMELRVHDKDSYRQIFDLMGAVSRRHESLPKSYAEAIETIAMSAGETALGKRFEDLDAKSGKGYDRTWSKQAYRDIKEIPLSKRVKSIFFKKQLTNDRWDSTVIGTTLFVLAAIFIIGVL